MTHYFYRKMFRDMNDQEIFSSLNMMLWTDLQGEKSPDYIEQKNHLLKEVEKRFGQIEYKNFHWVTVRGTAFDIKCMGTYYLEQAIIQTKAIMESLIKKDALRLFNFYEWQFQLLDAEINKRSFFERKTFTKKPEWPNKAQHKQRN